MILTDFGLARKVGEEVPPEKNQIAGSMPYVSNDVVVRKVLSKKNDLVSLAYMAIYMFVGSLPWSHVSHSSSNAASYIIDMKSDFNEMVIFVCGLWLAVDGVESMYKKLICFILSLESS